jgi:hypothetical protein
MVEMDSQEVMGHQGLMHLIYNHYQMLVICRVIFVHSVCQDYRKIYDDLHTIEYTICTFPVVSKAIEVRMVSKVRVDYLDCKEMMGLKDHKV